MRYVKWGFWAVLFAIVATFLHYNLPRHDIVRIVGTEVRRVDFGENSIFWATPDVGTANATSRDVRFINTVRPNGKTLVFRNEDTGWGWPPYFKLDSISISAHIGRQVQYAHDIISSECPSGYLHPGNKIRFSSENDVFQHTSWTRGRFREFAPGDHRDPEFSL